MTILKLFQVKPSPFTVESLTNWLYKDTKAKCSHLKKITCKGTLRQMFISVYRLEKHSVMLEFFQLSFVSCCHSTFSVVHLAPLTPFPVWLSIQYTPIRCVKVGMGSLEERWPQKDKHLPQSPFTGQFFRWDILVWCLYGTATNRSITQRLCHLT